MKRPSKSTPSLRSFRFIHGVLVVGVLVGAMKPVADGFGILLFALFVAIGIAGAGCDPLGMTHKSP
jgi:hypothetical protein